MEKLVFMSTRSNEDRDSVVVRIDREASQMLADIQQRTGFSLRLIASRMIEIAYENVTGARSVNSATGYWSANSATGDWSANLTTGYWSANSATGARSANSATGDWSANLTTGYGSANLTTGAKCENNGEGERNICIGWGRDNKCKGAVGCFLVLSEWGDWDGEKYPLIGAVMVEVDGETIKANTYYILKNGEIMEAK